MADNTMEAYATDLERFNTFQESRSPVPSTEDLRAYIDYLSSSGLGSRSIARHLTTIRNFLSFLLREGVLTTDPAEHLRGPKQWQTLPKFLNRDEIGKLLSWCGLPFEPSCLKFYENERAVRTASSEQVRQPIFSEAVDHWRNYEPWLGPLKEALGPVVETYPLAP